VLRQFDGRFELLDVPPATTVWVFATAPGYAGGRSAEIILGQRESREGADVRLIRGGGITGRVTGPDGVAVADASVFVDVVEESAGKTAFDRALKNALRSHAPRVRSSSVGEFLLPNLLPGSFKLVVIHPDFVTHEVQPIVVAASQQTVVPDLRLSRGARIRGRVRRQDGSADPQAAVQVTSVADPDRTSGSQLAYTKREGRFEVTGLAAGQYRIVVVQREGLLNMPRPFKFAEPNIVTLEVGETKELDV
jgi:hypothetical protein